jgi:deoxyribodipyrimidine photo-lyase
MPRIEWYRGMAAEWTIGEAAAAHRLDAFIDSGLDGYAEGRNRPDLRHVSRLSPHLHFGEISPHQVWHAVQSARQRPARERDAEVFLSELGWREFSCYLLRHFPELPTKNLQRRFDRFPWRSGGDSLDRWQRGLTGYPIVDAGMRELWTTGYMHNRVRMIVGSFLVKNLLLHWHHGETWFWDTLVDADLANNSAGWQWVAGSGADASPYFRIFNPVTQGRKFDPQGDYVRRFVPELRELDADELHEPWQARRRGAASEYPEPIVDLKASREQALEAFRFSASV